MIKTTYRQLKRIIRKNKVRFWTRMVQNRCAKANGTVRANYKTIVTDRTYLGHNINFNGMKIMGGGRVDIGDNFHSGTEC